MIKDLERVHLYKCAEIFYRIYKNNYSWIEYNSVSNYFLDIFNTPKFKGFIMLKNNNIIGGCLGVISDYFKIKKYRISEIFIDLNYSGKGFGTEMLIDIQNYLKKIYINIIELKTDRTQRAFDFYIKNNYTVLENNVNMIKSLR